MSDYFEILARFLDKAEGEVEGREVSEPTEELKQKMRALARGELETGEQAGVFEALGRHPQWVSWLAAEVKALRTPAS